MTRALCSACRNTEARQSLTLPAVQSEEPADAPRGRGVCSKLDNTPGGELACWWTNNDERTKWTWCGCMRIILYTVEVSSLILFSSNERKLQLYIQLYTHTHIYIYCNYMYIYFVMSMGKDGNGSDRRGNPPDKRSVYGRDLCHFRHLPSRFCEHELIFVTWSQNYK